MTGGKSSKGFTIIEVMIFLAVAGLLFVGVVAGTGASVARRRYQSSVQELAEFLRAQYSAVANIQNTAQTSTNHKDWAYCASDLLAVANTSNWTWNGGRFDEAAITELGESRGRSNCLIYGRIIVFGDTLEEDSANSYVLSYDLLGKDYYAERTLSTEDRQEIESGKDPISGDRVDATLAALNAVGLSPFVSKVFNNCSLEYGSGRTHVINWGAKAEVAANDDMLKKSIMIVRSPIDGAIHTYVYDGTIELSQIAGKYLLSSDGQGNGSCTGSSGSLSFLSANSGFIDYVQIMNGYKDSDPKWKTEEVEICVGSDDVFANGDNRRMIRMNAAGRNSSAVELLDADMLRDNGDPLCEK